MWVKGVIKDRRDITAVQTLRNQLMAATFLEGETILVLAGLAAHQGYLVLTWVILAAFLGSLCGDQLFFIWDASIVRWFYPGGRAGSRKRKKFTK